MVRRSTWIVFMVFLVLGIAAIFLVKSPSSPLGNANVTPSATPAPRMVESVEAADVNKVELVQVGGVPVRLARQADGTWLNEVSMAPVEAGKVEEVLSELLTTRVLTTMPADYSLDSLALKAPAQTITLSYGSGQILHVYGGGLTPTGNGYYVRVDNNAPVVVSKYAFEAVLQAFNNAVAPTPTPFPTIAIATPTP